METTKERVARVIAGRVRPAMAAHGGDIELVDVGADGVVTVRLMGACASCLGAADTLSALVAAEIRAACPEVVDVVADSGVSEEMIREALELIRRNRKD